MPSHLELTKDESQAIASWILENGMDENENFYVDIEGSIRLRVPGDPGMNRAFILRATY